MCIVGSLCFKTFETSPRRLDVTKSNESLLDDEHAADTAAFGSNSAHVNAYSAADLGHGDRRRGPGLRGPTETLPQTTCLPLSPSAVWMGLVVLGIGLFREIRRT